jgi:acyl dehydratase
VPLSTALNPIPLEGPSRFVIQTGSTRFRRKLKEEQDVVLRYDDLMQASSTNVAAHYSDRETILYALGIGFMRDPINREELPFVYEANLKTVPTMAAVIGRASANLVSRLDLNLALVVHGEQRLTLHKPLPRAADIVFDDRVVGAYDKGDKGALILIERELREKDTDEKLCTLGMTIVARGDGGFGGPRNGAPEPHVMPLRTPDLVHEADTRLDQAFLYALSGDRNPLHRDPNFAKTAGFPRPILHGLCSYGTACRSIISTVCGYDPTKITGIDVRFSAPVFPGETIVTEIWIDGNVVSYRSKLKERDVVVLNNGRCTLAEHSAAMPKSD